MKGTGKDREVSEALGRIERDLATPDPLFTVCADCAYVSKAAKQKRWICLARPHERDPVDGRWSYATCVTANSGYCELFKSIEPKAEPTVALRHDSTRKSKSFWARCWCFGGGVGE